MLKAQAESTLNTIIDFIKSKGLLEELIDFVPKADRDDLNEFIKDGEFEDDWDD